MKNSNIETGTKMSLDIQKVIEQFKQVLIKIRGDNIHSIFLYNSSDAHGNKRLDSDSDILIILKGEFNYSETLKLSDNLAASLPLKNIVVISGVFVHEKDFRERQIPFSLMFTVKEVLYEAYRNPRNNF